MTVEAVNYRRAIGRSIAHAMERNEKVIFFGEDVAVAGGAFKSTPGLFEQFGGERVRDTPISEQAIVGAALGAAITGLRPIAEIMFADFAGVCFDQIANQVAKYRYMTGGQAIVPLVIRMHGGAGAGFGAQHSQPAENWFLNIPGLKIAVPATVEDLFGLFQSAVDDDNPVLFIEHKNLFNVEGTLDPTAAPIPLGKADVVRTGADLTIVATQQMRHRAVAAAAQLDEEGVRATVIDPRTLVPFDDQTVLESLSKTSRLLVVQEGAHDGSWGASLTSRICSTHWQLLDAPVKVLCSPDTPVPYAGPLEEAWLPSVDEIVAEARKLVAY